MRLVVEMVLWHALAGVTFGGIIYATRGLDSAGASTDTGLYLWLLCSCGIGAAIAGGLLALTYGHRGGLGALSAAMGFGLATSLAAMICGNLFVPAFEGFVAPSFVINLILETPLYLLPWAAIGTALHLRARALRLKDAS
ncbi:MAG: hypothetical protein MK180_02510 [Rhodobacteraceae bacterium]|nr:hypothetical protein [Paracoccaceae bacterium]